MSLGATDTRALADAHRILVTRALRGFGDGLVSVLLASYLTRLGLTPFEVGAIVTGTLLGSAVLTMALGLGAHRLECRRVLIATAMLMLATGIGFAGLTTFWPLFIVAVIGTLNPSAGDVSVFVPMEQATLARTTTGHDRTRLFAWYNVAGGLTGALGSLASGIPALAAHAYGIDLLAAERWGFVLYALIAVASATVYMRLERLAETQAPRTGGPLPGSRRVVLRLATLFCLDSFGGGFVVQSLLVLWLYQRFGLSIEVAATIFFAAGIAGAVSQLVSPALARRIGLVPTMVCTHLPANLFLIAAGLAPSAPAAVTFLLLRALLSQMDVPPRQAYVMAVVPPEERAAAASVTSVPRGLAAAVPPLFTGLMLSQSAVGWPLVCGGLLKAAYDLILFTQFKTVQPATDT